MYENIFSHCLTTLEKIYNESIFDTRLSNTELRKLLESIKNSGVRVLFVIGQKIYKYNERNSILSTCLSDKISNSIESCIKRERSISMLVKRFAINMTLPCYENEQIFNHIQIDNRIRFYIEVNYYYKISLNLVGDLLFEFRKICIDNLFYDKLPNFS
jgi:hypothetical protein